MLAMHTFWLSCLEHFEKELSAQQFNTWIKPLHLDYRIIQHEAQYVIAPNRFVMQWIKDHFCPASNRWRKNIFRKTYASS